MKTSIDKARDISNCLRRKSTVYATIGSILSGLSIACIYIAGINKGGTLVANEFIGILDEDRL